MNKYRWAPPNADSHRRVPFRRAGARPCAGPRAGDEPDRARRRVFVLRRTRRGAPRHHRHPLVPVDRPARDRPSRRREIAPTPNSSRPQRPRMRSSMPSTRESWRRRRGNRRRRSSERRRTRSTWAFPRSSRGHVLAPVGAHHRRQQG
jgi:hypothetical protein